MNRKQLLILLVLAVLLGAAGLILHKRSNEVYDTGSNSMGKKLLGDLPVNDIAHLSIKQGANEVNLQKKQDLWRVRERNDYPANYSEISEFLLKARDLKIVQVEKIGPSQLGRFELAPGPGTNSASIIEFRDQNDKPLRTLILGKKHMRKSGRSSPMGEMGEEGWPDGRYVKLGTDADNVELISEPLANIEPKPDQWLNKDFFKVERLRAISLTSTNATNSWKLSRDTESGEWKLADAKPGEQFDNAKVSSLGSQLNSPTFNDVAQESKAGEYGLEHPTVLALDTFDDFSYTLKVGQKTNDNLALMMTVAAQFPKERTPGKDEKPEDKARLDKEFKDKQVKLEEKLAQEKTYEKWVYLVSPWTLEPFLKDRSQLMADKKETKTEEAGTNAPVVSNIVSVPAATNTSVNAPPPASTTSTNAGSPKAEPPAQPGSNPPK